MGAVDWDLRDFHGYLTDRGTTYNAFLILDEKVTLIDTVKAPFKQAAQAVSDLLRIPILGPIAAGEPLQIPTSDFGYYDAESTIEVPPSQLPGREKGKDLFALEVVAIWLGDKNETTLKYFFRENGHVRLQPANPTMEPIYIDDPSELEIKGKVVMVIRQVSGLPS